MDEVNTSIEHEGNKLFAAEDSSSSTASSAVVRWQPKQITFRPYVSTHDDDVRANSQPLRVVVKRPLVSKLTKDIVDTYQICNSEFRFLSDLNPKRFLTTPSNGVLNDGHDNANSDLILSVNYALVNKDANRRYIVKDILGHGTFGQVVKCWVADMNAFIAVKVIKNQPAYYQQALVEVSILTTLNRKFDPEDKHHIVRIYEYFVCQRHLCIAFELLETNLYELIKLNQFRGLSLTIVQLFSKQILHGLTLMKDAGIIHCDLKPENILLCSSSKPAEIKIIDFGSACIEDRTVYSYIQSRYYRSPEVVLGYHYTTAIDMWSFGCIVAELFLGLPLFPGSSEFDLLRRMIKIIGGQPPDYMLKEAKNTSKFFKYARSVNHEESGANPLHRSRVYEVLTEEDYEARDTRKPAIGKEYFNHKNLEAIVRTYPYKKNLPQEELIKESQMRLALVDFLRGLVEFDPAKRWSPLQASKHPFLTGEPFTSPYKPAPETPSVPVSHNAKVNHHPAGGHWFAAGLSPNISSRNRGVMQNSPRFQVMPPYAHAAAGGGSYGSLGSHGSYNDGGVLGSSYGSYGDNTNLLAFCSPVGPSGMNMYPQNNGMLLGSSPDTRRIMQQLPHSNGLGMSPGNYMPMSLGSSPSQYTPTGGHYGPASPAARGSCHGLGSPLGKGHYNNNNNNFNRRKSGPTNYSATTTGSSTRGSFVQFQNSRDKPEPSNSVPDPADWDPNYSVELLLQEDNSDASASTVTNDLKAMNLSQGLEPVEPVRRYNHLQNSSPSMSMQRPPNGHIQAYSSHGEAGTSPRTSHSHPLSVPSHMKHHSMGQGSNRLPLYPPAQRFNHGRSQAQWDPNRVHASLPSYQSGVPHYSAATNGTPPQGRRGNNYPPVGILPPVSRGRKDNGGGNSSN